MGGGNFVIPARRDNVAGSDFRFQFRFRFRFQRGARTIDGGGNAKCVGAVVGLRWSILLTLAKRSASAAAAGAAGKIIVRKKLKRRGVIFPPEKNEK